MRNLFLIIFILIQYLSFGQLRTYKLVNIKPDTTEFVYNDDTADVQRTFDFLTINKSYYFKDFKFCFGGIGETNRQNMVVLDKNKMKVKNIFFRGEGLSNPRFYSTNAPNDVSFVTIEVRSKWTWSQIILIINKDNLHILNLFIDIGYSDEEAVKSGVAPPLEIFTNGINVTFKTKTSSIFGLSEDEGEPSKEVTTKLTNLKYIK